MNQKNHSSDNIPQLRFPEFTGEWERKKLGEFLEFKNGINASKEQYGSGYKFINVLDILNNDFITHDKIIGSVNVDEETVNKYPVSYGDILFQRSSETREEVGSASVYLDKHNIATFGGFVIRGRKIGDYDPVFLNKLLKTDASRDSITSKSGGSTRYNVGQEILSSVKLYFPEIPEQEKIGSFFTLIDEKIKSLKKKHSLLEQYKKGVMQKLFSQELRFKDENGIEFPEWEEKQVKDLFKVTRGDVLAMSLVSDEVENEHIYPVYSSQTKNRGLAGYYNEYLFEDAITWTTDGAGAGDVNFREGKFYCTNVCGVLLSDEGYANLFIAELLNSVSRKYVSYVGNPKLMNNVMAEISIIIPVSVEEQQRISSFLKSLNVRIKQLESEISKIENWKKGLLQKMFV
jgi:type I restriction enzyme, S subunit